MTEHTITTIRQLLEADNRIQQLKKAFTEDPGDKNVGKALERAYYQTGDYINARKTRLGYMPYNILIARSPVIHNSGRQPYRITLYLNKYSRGVAEFVTGRQVEGNSERENGLYVRDFNAAERNFLRSVTEEGLVGRRFERLLPDGYPYTLELYRDL